VSGHSELALDQLISSSNLLSTTSPLPYYALRREKYP
jgi:hypothetical protein